MVATGLYQSYDSSGIKLLVLFVSCNLYIFFLQFLWRFSSEDNLEINTYRARSSDSFVQTPVDEKNPVGMNYFAPNYQVEISHNRASLDNSRATVENMDQQYRNQNYENQNIIIANNEPHTQIINNVNANMKLKANNRQATEPLYEDPAYREEDRFTPNAYNDEPQQQYEARNEASGYGYQEFEDNDNLEIRSQKHQQVEFDNNLSKISDTENNHYRFN